MVLPIMTYQGGGEIEAGMYGTVGYEYEDKAYVWGYSNQDGFTCWCERPAGYWFGLIPFVGALTMAAGILLLALNRPAIAAVLLGLSLIVFMTGLGDFRPFRDSVPGSHSSSVGPGFWLWLLGIAGAGAAAVKRRRTSPHYKESPDALHDEKE